MTQPIDGSRREKLYESQEDEDAKIREQEDRLEKEYEASKKEPKCDPDVAPGVCLPAAKDKTPSGTSYADLKMQPQAAQRGYDDVKRDVDLLSDKLAKNGSYVGRREDEQKLAQLRKELDTTPNPHVVALPNTTTSTRGKDGVTTRDAGTDGATVYAQGKIYGTKVSDKIHVDAGEVSAQFGVSSDVSITTARMTITGDDGSTMTIQGPGARFTQGFGRNDDGSIGYHAGAEATIVSNTITTPVGKNGGSVTMGASEGVGAGGSVGVKPTPDGGSAVCGQVSALFFTVGACVPVGRM